MSKPIWVRLRSVLKRDVDASSVELSRESAEEMLAEIKRLTAEVEKLNSELTDALTDLATARQDNASFGPELKRLTAENEKLRAALAVLQAAMTAKKPIPLAFKRAIIEARAALSGDKHE